MGKRRVLSVLLSLILIGSLTGCNKFKEDKGSKVSISSIREKYEKEEKTEYVEPMYNLERDHQFKFDMDANVKDKVELEKVFEVYTDASLKQKVDPKIEYNDSEGKIVISPPSYPVWASLEELKALGIEDLTAENADTYVNSNWNKDWGNASNYYLVQNYDTKTGEKFNKPIVNVFTIRPELQTPTVKFYTTDEGIAGLEWDKIEGAESYLIYSIAKKDSVEGVNVVLEGETTDTKFEDFKFATIDFDDSVISMNTTFDISDGNEDMFGVMAVSEGKKSLVSNLIDSEEYGNKTPCTIALENNESLFEPVEGVEKLPTHLPIKMANGKEVLCPVSYDIESKEIVTYKEDNTPALKIKSKIEGTAFTWTCYVIHINEDTLDSDLKKVEKRQNDIKGKSLEEKIEVNIPSTPSKDAQNDNNKDKKNEITVKEGDTKVFATTALSEYIAINMLEGKEKISLNDFPEASSREVLLDNLLEAKYQNPLVMKIEGANIDYDNNELIVIYGQDRDTQKKKQDEVKDEVRKVVKDIIKDGMTDLEKEIAINNYLCESAEYDNAALENAKANNMRVDASFNDSFTPYGILVKKVGVCASYASSFKLLADGAGLECIVVNGTLEGGLRHAWNRVKIDGNWMSIDVTNNDKDFMPNVLLNIPDNVSRSVLVEGNEYINDGLIGSYEGRSENLEYYRVENKYFSKDKIATELAKGLKDNKQVSIRTDYDLTKKEFYEIVNQTMNEGEIKEIEEGTYWLGVIYLKVD